MFFTNYRPFANHYYERNNSCFCLFKNLFSLSFPICSQIYYFCKLIINRLSTIESHPLWVRGLKQAHPQTSPSERASHPLWVRGLKLEVILHQQVESRSHPLWVRGLKLRWAMVKALRTDIAHFVGVD